MNSALLAKLGAGNSELLFVQFFGALKGMVLEPWEEFYYVLADIYVSFYM